MSQPRGTLHVLMPMAGLGTRVRDWNELAKPLIPIAEKPLYSWALSSLEALERRVIGVIREEHLPLFGAVRTDFCALIHTPVVTRGPAHTAFLAKDLIPPGAPLLVLDCDVWFSAPEFLAEVMNPRADGAVCTFPATASHFCYATTENGILVDLREKECVSKNAVLGAYFFRSARNFFAATETLLQKSGENEIFVSHVISEELRRGASFTAVPCRRHLSLGTSAEISANAPLLSAAQFRT